MPHWPRRPCSLKIYCNGGSNLWRQLAKVPALFAVILNTACQYFRFASFTFRPFFITRLYCPGHACLQKSFLSPARRRPFDFFVPLLLSVSFALFAAKKNLGPPQAAAYSCLAKLSLNPVKPAFVRSSMFGFPKMALPLGRFVRWLWQLWGWGNISGSRIPPSPHSKGALDRLPLQCLTRPSPFSVTYLGKLEGAKLSVVRFDTCFTLSFSRAGLARVVSKEFASKVSLAHDVCLGEPPQGKTSLKQNTCTT